MRVLFFSLCISIAFSGCKNEPYDPASLTILSIKGTSAGAETRTFTYASQRVATFTRTGGTSPTSMKFHYHGDNIGFITSDSSVAVSRLSTTDSLRKTSFKRALFERTGDKVIDRTYQYVIDSVFDITVRKSPVLKSVTGDTTILSIREIVFEASGAPLQVEMTTWPLNVETKVKVDLTWENANVTRTLTTTTTQGNVVTKETVFRYDDQQSGFTLNPQYVYTFNPGELYWLSNNNPLVINDGSGEKIYIYSYNKLGYPASYISDTGITYGFTYRQLQ